MNRGDVLDEVSISANGEEILEKVVAVASGERTFSDSLGFGRAEFLPWQIGAMT